MTTTLKANTVPELVAKIKTAISGGWHIKGGAGAKGFLNVVYFQEMIKTK